MVIKIDARGKAINGFLMGQFFGCGANLISGNQPFECRRVLLLAAEGRLGAQPQEARRLHGRELAVGRLQVLEEPEHGHSIVRCDVALEVAGVPKLADELEPVSQGRLKLGRRDHVGVHADDLFLARALGVSRFLGADLKDLPPLPFPLGRAVVERLEGFLLGLVAREDGRLHERLFLDDHQAAGLQQFMDAPDMPVAAVVDELEAHRLVNHVEAAAWLVVANRLPDGRVGCSVVELLALDPGVPAFIFLLAEGRQRILSAGHLRRLGEVLGHGEVGVQTDGADRAAGHLGDGLDERALGRRDVEHVGASLPVTEGFDDRVADDGLKLAESRDAGGDMVVEVAAVAVVVLDERLDVGGAQDSGVGAPGVRLAALAARDGREEAGEVAALSTALRRLSSYIRSSGSTLIPGGSGFPYISSPTGT